jgi:hypothetical protein
MTNDQFFSHIMARTSYIRRDNSRKYELNLAGKINMDFIHLAGANT